MVAVTVAAAAAVVVVAAASAVVAAVATPPLSCCPPLPLTVAAAAKLSMAFSDNWVSWLRRSFCSRSSSCCFSPDFWMSYTQRYKLQELRVVDSNVQDALQEIVQ